MNAYNPLISAQRLEASGLPRRQAEAIAAELAEGTDNFVTEDRLEAALNKQTIKISVIVGAMLTLSCTVLGTLMTILASR